MKCVYNYKTWSVTAKTKFNKFEKVYIVVIIILIITIIHLKIPEEFVHLIPQGRFLIVHIRFVHIVKFEILAQFPVDHLAHPVVSNLILLLC